MKRREKKTKSKTEIKKAASTLTIAILLVVSFPQVIHAQPLPIGDVNYRQANPFDSNPTIGTYSGVGTPTGVIINAFDGDLSTSIAFGYGYSANGYVEVSAFKKPSDNGLTDFAITWIDIKISYKAASTSTTDDQYRIVAYVGPSGTPVVLQDWVTGNDAKYDLGNGVQGHRVFSNVAEANDGTWTWSDLASLRVRFETKQIGTNNFQRVTLYEVWVTAYSTPYPAANTISVQPSAVIGLHAGDVFFIDVYVTDVADMLGYQILLNFTPTVLTALEYLSYGPFVSAWPSEIGSDHVALAYNTYIPDPVGFTGDTPIARIYFQAVADGTSVLTLSKSEVADVLGRAIVLTPKSGVFASNPVRDVAVTDVTVNPINVLPDEPVEIGATVMNQGTSKETFDVSTFYDSIPINTQTVSNLLPGDSQILSFLWDTSGVSVGFHKISVEAALVGDENPSNNVKVWDADGLVPEGVLVGRHDIVVTNIVCAYSNGTTVPADQLLNVTRGEIVYINATIANLGNFSEIFDVTAVWQGYLSIGNITNVSLLAETNRIVSFAWNTDVTVPPWRFLLDRYGRPVNYSRGPVMVIAAPGWTELGEIYSKGVPYEKRPKSEGVPFYDYTANNIKETVRDVQVNRDLRYPTAIFCVDRLKLFVGEPAEFWGGPPWYSQTPPGTTIVSYRWDFGDGYVAEGNYPTITHVYTGPGWYSVNLTITNSVGLSSSVATGQIGAPISRISVTERNVKIVSVTVSPTIAVIAQNVAINVTIKNDGVRDEFFLVPEAYVTVYYDNVMIGRVQPPHLGPWDHPTSSNTVAFDWDTSGLNPGTYTITAALDVLPYENNTADNTLTDGVVTLFTWDYVFTDSTRGTTLKINTAHKFFQFITPQKDYGIKHDLNMIVLNHIIIIRFEDAEIRLHSITVDTHVEFCVARAEDTQTGETYWLLQRPRHWVVGDANYDGVVDILDAGVISAHWYPGPPIGPLGYDPNADINSDGVVNMLDAAIASANWGHTNP